MRSHDIVSTLAAGDIKDLQWHLNMGVFGTTSGELNISVKQSIPVLVNNRYSRLTTACQLSVDMPHTYSVGIQ